MCGPIEYYQVAVEMKHFEALAVLFSDDVKIVPNMFDRDLEFSTNRNL